MSDQLRVTVMAVIALIAAPLVVFVQTAKASSIPRGRDGGPGLSDIWQAMNTAAWDLDPTGTYDITHPRTRGSRLHEILKERSGVAPQPKP
jgi:hypothetical protein